MFAWWNARGAQLGVVFDAAFHRKHVCLKNHAYVQQYLCMSGKLAVHQWSDMCIDLIVAARSLSIPERYMYHRRSAERDHGRKTSYAQLNFFDASDIVAYL